MIESYYNEVVKVLTQIKDTQGERMEAAARVVADVIKSDGIIYIFGCGHSHLIGMDCFYRAGGLANVSPVLEEELMLHISASRSSYLEKQTGIAQGVFEKYPITEKDMLIVISTSGKNSVPVEMAQAASEKGIRNVSVVSSAYFADKKDKPLLYECSDIFIDNCVPHGDAVMDVPGAETKMGSVSTAASSFILQAVLIKGAEYAGREGAELPIYMSGNIEGGAEYNKALIEKYQPLIRHL